MNRCENGWSKFNGCFRVVALKLPESIRFALSIKSTNFFNILRAITPWVTSSWAIVLSAVSLRPIPLVYILWHNLPVWVPCRWWGSFGYCLCLKLFVFMGLSVWRSRDGEEGGLKPELSSWTQVLLALVLVGIVNFVVVCYKVSIIIGIHKIISQINGL